MYLHRMNTLPLTTERLLLLPCTADHIEAYMEDRSRLADLTGLAIPDSWPVFPEGIPWWLEELRADPSMVGWANWIVALKDEKIAVGDGGFKGKPKEDGSVEIGYAIVPEFRNRGIATEATRALIAWAFSHPEVESVCAHTLAEGVESINVLKKNGMGFVSGTHDPEDGEIFLWRLPRTLHSSTLLTSFSKQQLS